MPDWDLVYTEKNIADANPAEVLSINSHLLNGKGKALDFASGLGGNACYLSAMGYDVEAWDLSKVAVDKINQHAKDNNLKLTAQLKDLESHLPCIKNQFDIVVVSYFLHRENLRYLHTILKPQGLLFYQTFSGEQYQQQGPGREDFRLKKGELLSVFSDMQLIFYREDIMSSSGPNAKQGQTYFVAKK